MEWHCKLCDKSFDESELTNATLLSKKAGVSTYRFADGMVHAFRKPMSEKWKHSMHIRWHVGRINVSDCLYCNPEPIMGIGVTDLRQQVAELESVEPDPVEAFLEEENPIGIKPEEVIQEAIKELTSARTPADDFHDNTMSYAFSKFKENKNGR